MSITKGEVVRRCGRIVTIVRSCGVGSEGANRWNPERTRGDPDSWWDRPVAFCSFGSRVR